MSTPKSDGFTPKLEELQAELERLRLENESLKNVKSNAKVRRTPGNQIAVWVDGRKPPITLPPEQWKQIFTQRRNDIKELVEKMLTVKESNE